MTTEYQKYLDPEVLAGLQGLQLRARRIVEGYVSGMHRSPYQGFSIEFAEHREYVPGDDLRYVDWKVFGRTDKFYLKQYEEETNLVCQLLLDTSRSMEYRGPDAAMSKLDYARCVAAALAYLVFQQQDSVGLVTFSDQIHALVRAGGNPSHLRQILHVLEQSPGGKKTATGPIFHELAERFKRRGVVIVLSDLFDDVDKMIAGLKHLRHKRNDVILLHILDPAELDFPFRETTLFHGLEDNANLTAEPRSLRKAYLREFGGYLRRLKKGCRAERIDYAMIRTDRPMDVALRECLGTRAM